MRQSKKRALLENNGTTMTEGDFFLAIGRSDSCVCVEKTKERRRRERKPEYDDTEGLFVFLSFGVFRTTSQIQISKFLYKILDSIRKDEIKK